MLSKEQLKDKALTYLQSYQADMEQLQSDREKFLKYYYQDKTIYDQPEGRSSVVSSDVHDVVEALLPSLMDIFWGGTDVVQVRPQGPEDEQAAQAMETLLNFQIQRQIDGYRVFHDWIKDSLLQKISFVKYGWNNSTEKVEKEYKGLNALEVQALTENPKLTITDIEKVEIEAAVVDDSGFELSAAVYEFTVTGYEEKKISKPWVEFCPGEEVIFDVQAKNIKDMKFIAHRKRVHKSHLNKYNVDADKVKTLIDEWADSLRNTKFKDLGGEGFYQDKADENFVYIYECFFCDYKKDGTILHKKVTVFGDEVLKVEDNSYKRPPFCALSPVLMPGRLVGRSEAELAMEFQDVSTSLTRSILDTAYYNVLGMRIVNPHRIDPQTLLDGNRPGGLILTKEDIPPSQAVHEMQPSQVPNFVFDMLQYQESKKENKTGVNKYSMGTDSNAINKTATGVAILSSNAQLRSKQIARNMASTGISDLFNCMAKMNLDYLDSEVAIRLDNKWQSIRRDTIDGEYDIIVDTGIGSGNKEIRVQQMMQMLNLSMPLLQMQVVTPENIQEQVKTIYELWGYKNSDKYINTDLPQMMMMQRLQAMGMMGGMNGTQGMAGQGIPAATGMESYGGGADPQGAFDSGVQAAVSAASPQPLV